MTTKTITSAQLHNAINDVAGDATGWVRLADGDRYQVGSPGLTAAIFTALPEQPALNVEALKLAMTAARPHSKGCLSEDDAIEIAAEYARLTSPTAEAER